MKESTYLPESNYLLDTWRKKLLYSLGLVIALFYALFCGISLAGYVVLTFGTGGGALLGALLGAFVCTAANFKTSINKIPEILVDFFGRKHFFDGYFSQPAQEDDDSRYLKYQPWHKRAWHTCKRYRLQIGFVVGIFLSFLAGLAIFGQGYGGITVGLMAFAGLTVATSAITGIGLFGAIIFFVAFWAITLKAIILELQKRGWFEQCKKFFTDLFDVGGECHLHPHRANQPRLSLGERFTQSIKGFFEFCRNPNRQALRDLWQDLTHTCIGQHKSKLRTYLEGGVLVVLLTAAAPLAIIGVVTAMMASHLGILKFVSDTWPSISEQAMNVINGFSWVFVVGLASLGQLPFYLKTTMNTFKRLGKWGMYNVGRLFGGRSEAEYETSEQLSFGDKAMYAVRLVNAGYSALYSYVGGGSDHSFLADAGAVGGVINSFSAPEKIGGTGFSDIWRNFKAEPASEQVPLRSGWPSDNITDAQLSRDAASAMAIPLLGTAGARGGNGPGRISSYQTLAGGYGSSSRGESTITSAGNVARAGRDDELPLLPMKNTTRLNNY